MTCRRITILTLILTFGLVSAVYADFVWPALRLVPKLVTWWVILSGLVIEYLFVRKLTGFSIMKSILVDLSMNLASTLFGMLLIPLAGIVSEILTGMIFNTGTFSLA
jgi:hypothetical protein